jgi:hypothetical protein
MNPKEHFLQKPVTSHFTESAAWLHPEMNGSSIAKNIRTKSDFPI